MATMNPIKPKLPVKTGRRDHVLYTIHKMPNKVYAVKTSKLVSIVGFRNMEHAYIIANMFEEYKRITKDWPNFMDENHLILPKPDIFTQPNELSVVPWDSDELKYYCVSNILDLVTFERVVETKDGFKITGESMSFEAPCEFYRERFDEMYKLIAVE